MENNISKAGKKRSRLTEVVRNLRRNRMAMAGLFIICVFAFMAIFADVFLDYDTDVIGQNIPEHFQGPSAEHLFGTDELGRDVLARIIYGSRASMLVGLVAVSFSMIIGVPLGAIAAYYGGKLGEFIMRCSDILSALPSMMLALMVVTAFGQSMLNLVIAVGISSIPGYIRISRAAVLTTKNQEYVEAARSIGCNNPLILMKHILPNCLAPIIVQATMRVATAILSIASLSFLGLGIKPPTPEWGLMLASGRDFIRDAWWMTFFPGLAIMLIVLSLNMLGDCAMR